MNRRGFFAGLGALLASSVMPALARTPLRRFIPARFEYRAVVLNEDWMLRIPSYDEGLAYLVPRRREDGTLKSDEACARVLESGFTAHYTRGGR